jgi:hypothetical protein
MDSGGRMSKINRSRGVSTRKLDCHDQICVPDVGKAMKYAFRSQLCRRCHGRVSPTCAFHFLDAGMEQAADAEIEGGQDERKDEWK